MKVDILQCFISSAAILGAMNYAKFTVVMAGSIALKQYLEDQKSSPPTFEINELKNGL